MWMVANSSMNSKKTSPIALFVYNRLRHTRQTVGALQKNDLASDSTLFIFSDGPKTETEHCKVEELRKYLDTIIGFKQVRIIKRNSNWGLAKSIISGVGQVVNEFGRAIVLEDDLVTNPFFLKYMNESLELYENQEKVISIHGYVYPVKNLLPQTFFLRGADCWGWGTWKRGWDLFEEDGLILLKSLKKGKLTKIFDFNNAYPYTKMLQKQITGKNDSWAIRWYASAFLKGKLTLYPGISLVSNIGLDGSGTHCNEDFAFSGNVSQKFTHVEEIGIEESKVARRAFELFLKESQGSYFRRFIRKIRAIKAFTKTNSASFCSQSSQKTS